MTLEQIKRELALMPQDQQDHLAAYLVHLRQLREPQFRQDVARKIEDRDPAHWVSPAELREHWKDRG